MPFANVTAVVRRRMARIRKSDTKPELAVRRVAHRLGYRYRLHRRNLPGTPDVVFSSLKKVVLVHGCFWHQHDCPLGRKQPAKRQEYWLPKLTRNQRRDVRNEAALRELGFDVLVVWECEIRDASALQRRLASFLEG
jgi:DNA mismatch endonuclease (patch repair protein)